MVWSLIFQNDDIIVESIFNRRKSWHSRRIIYILCKYYKSKTTAKINSITWKWKTHTFNLKYWQHETTIQKNNKSRAYTALTLLATLLDWGNQSIPKTLNRVLCLCANTIKGNIGEEKEGRKTDNAQSDDNEGWSPAHFHALNVYGVLNEDP
jgi:hypothetical protein